MTGFVSAVSTTRTTASRRTAHVKPADASTTAFAVVKDIPARLSKTQWQPRSPNHAICLAVGELLDFHSIDITAEAVTDAWRACTVEPRTPMSSIPDFSVGGWSLDVTATNFKQEHRPERTHGLVHVQFRDLLRLAGEVFVDAKPSTPQERAILKKAVDRFLSRRR